MRVELGLDSKFALSFVFRETMQALACSYYTAERLEEDSALINSTHLRK